MTASSVPSSTPVIEDDRVQFVWKGRRPPVLVGDFNDWDNDRALRLFHNKRGLWTRTLTFPRDAYLEYAFLLDGQRVFDPLNLRVTPNGIGDTNNYFYMPAGAPIELTRRVRGVPQGSLTTHRLETHGMISGRTRLVHLYRPPARGPYPLLVVLDGAEYLRRAKLPVIVDNLLAQKRVRPFGMAFVENGGAARPLEYASSDAHLNFLLFNVLPLAIRELDLTRQRGAHGILGASLGGRAAFYSALRAPEVFRMVLSQSGAFGEKHFHSAVNDLARYLPRRPLAVWMDVGRYEGLLRSNRRYRNLLRARGYAVTYREYNAGHNYPAWRNDVWRGLEELFGP
ncbi:MAG TPA: alpha/beta hydrolase-fold protein [Anaerolineae bacterium]